MFNKKRHFDYINKLIFVHLYQKAYYLLDNMLFKEDKLVDDNFCYHLRLVELAVKLNKTQSLKEKYLPIESINRPFYNLVVTFLDMFGSEEKVSSSIDVFNQYLEDSNYAHIAYYGCGICYNLSGNAEKAIESFTQSTKIKTDFYPSYFALSQLYFASGNVAEGNRNFFVFESYARYNVYGNFETHASLAQEFLKFKRYPEAQTAIKLLANWWEENKGYYPLELQIFENFMMSSIYEAQGDKTNKAGEYKEVAIGLARTAVNVIEKEDILFFVAKILEDYKCLDLAILYYEKVLKITSNSSFIQKIGSYFVSNEDYETLKLLFDKAYEYSPDNTRVKFYRLVSMIHEQGLDVGDYLSKKEMVLRLYTDDMLDYNFDAQQFLGSKITNNGIYSDNGLEAFLSLETIFDKDPDIQKIIASLYEKMFDNENAFKHYKKLLQIDPKSWDSMYAYVSFLFKNQEYLKDLETQAFEKMLDTLSMKKMGKKEQVELNYLASSYYYDRNDLDKSDEYCKKGLNVDSWSYLSLIRRIINITKRYNLTKYIKEVERLLLNVSTFNYTQLEDFESKTDELEAEGYLELSYLRRKLSFLLSSADQYRLEALVKTAVSYNPKEAIYDLIKLMNTNFDTPKIYIAIGLLHKELWQLDTALFWFDYYLDRLDVCDPKRAKAYVCIADCLVYLGKDLGKALEYSKLSLDLDASLRIISYTVMSHVDLKLGKIKEAKAALDQLRSINSIELTYLRGLLEYRNGKIKVAKTIWKPLVNKNCISIKDFHIKEEVLGYYFEDNTKLKEQKISGLLQ